VDLNFGRERPEAILDLTRVRALAEWQQSDGLLRVGAGVSYTRAIHELGTALPGLAAASRTVGSPQIRHRGTIGGNLAHADPASELPAVMLAAEAELDLASRQGTRVVPAEQFFAGTLTTAARPDELLTEIRVHGLPPRTGGAFLEIARRQGDYALVGVAALVTLNDVGRCERARIALCGVGSTPIRAAEAERALVGELPAEAALDAAAERAVVATDPPTDVHASAGFRRKLARVVARQAIELAAQRAGGA
jgi:carbon-monoxide dehydrogenase medium subunit